MIHCFDRPSVLQIAQFYLSSLALGAEHVLKNVRFKYYIYDFQWALQLYNKYDLFSVACENISALQLYNIYDLFALYIYTYTSQIYIYAFDCQEIDKNIGNLLFYISI